MVNRNLFYEELNKLQGRKANIIESALNARDSTIEAVTKQRNAARTQPDTKEPIQSFMQDSQSSAPNETESKNGHTLDTDSMRTSLEHVQSVRKAAEAARRLAQQQAALQAQSKQQQTALDEKGGSQLDGMNPTQRKAAAKTAMSEFNKQAQAAAYVMSATVQYPSMHAEYEKAAADYKEATEQYELALKEYNKAAADEDTYKESDAYKEEQRLAQTLIENASTIDELKHNLNICEAQIEALQTQLNSYYLIYDKDMYEAVSQDYKTYSELQAQTQQAYNAAVDKEIEANREGLLAQGYHAANFWDNTGLSVLRGYYESKYYKEMALEALGFENNADYWAEKLEDDKFKFFSDNHADQAVSGASGVVGQMGAELLSYETFFTTAAAVGFALTAGNTGPGAFLPEEIFTIPAAFAYGINAGMAVTGAQIEMGMAYVEMIEAGVDRDVAVLISIGVGTINGILESVQLDDVFKAFKILDKTGLDNTFTKRLTQYLLDQGVHIATETGQEVAQEMVTIAGVNAGKAASGLETDSLSDIGQRLKDTAVSSALTFGVLNVAGLSGRLMNTAITRESLGKLSAQESRAVNKAVTAKYAEHLQQDGVSQEHIDTYIKQSEKNATSKEAADKHTASVVEEMNKLNEQTSVASDFNVQRRSVLTDSGITTKLETKTAFTETELKSMDTVKLQNIVQSLSEDFAKSWKAAGLDSVAVDKQVSEMTRQTDTGELIKSAQIMQNELGFGEDLAMSKQSDSDVPLQKGKLISKENYNDFVSQLQQLQVKTEGFETYHGDVEVLKQIVEDIQFIRQQFPTLDNIKNGLLLKYENLNDIKTYAKTAGKTITLNKEIFDDIDYLKRDYKSEANDGFFVKGTDYRSIIYHEIGHVLNKQNPKLLGDMHKIIQQEAKTAGLKTDEYIEKNISKYAKIKYVGSYYYNELLPEIISMCYNCSVQEKTDLALNILLQLGLEVIK